jgi:chromosome condensin MukBEF MukE localization factor
MIVTITEERAVYLIEKVARFIVERNMAAPALIATEMFLPLNHIGSQLLYFVMPVAELIFDQKAYQEFATLIDEDRYLKMLSQRIDELDAEMYKDKYEKRRISRNKRNKKIKNFFLFWKKK